MLGVAVVGLGQVGQLYAKAIGECPSARLSIACDVDEGRLGWVASNLGTPVTSRFEDALTREDVDVVAVCLPHNLHFPVGSAALAAGKHLLVDKPMAMTVDECDQLIAAAAKEKLVVGVNHNRLFLPSHVRARDLIESGMIGEPVLLRLRLGVHEPFTDWRSDPKKNGGGLLSDFGAHQLYVARYLFGEVAGMRSMLDVPFTEGESLAIVWMDFEVGAHGLYEANYWGPPGMCDDRVEIVGSEAVLRLGGVEAASFGYRHDIPLECYRHREWTEDNVEFIDWEESIIRSVKAFLEALDEGSPVPVSGEDGRENVRLIHAVYSEATLLGKFTWPSLARPAGTSAL